MEEVLKKANFIPGKWNSPAVREGDDFGIINFQSKLCSYKARTGGCTFCTLENRNLGNSSYESQFDYAMNQFFNRKKKNLLLFNRNFFDEKELPRENRINLLKLAKGYATETITIESRPEYITNKRLKEMREILGDLEIDISLGIESANDFIREYYHHKGFTMKEFYQSKRVMDNYGASFVPFVFIKPYFMTESLAIKDGVKSIEKMLDLGAKRVSVQPLMIFEGGLGELLMNCDKASPPSLWSLYEIIKQVGNNSEVLVHAIDPKKMSPVPLRMANSCEDSAPLLRQILSGKQKLIDVPEYPSREDWRNLLLNEERLDPAERIILGYQFLKDVLSINAQIPKDKIRRDYEKTYNW